MKTLVIKKTLDVNAPKEKVWDVLTLDKFTRIWYNEFSPGSYAETDWKEGSKVRFKDSTGAGMVAEIEANKPYELLSIRYLGNIDKNGVDDTESEEAKAIQGGHEIYKLSELNGKTTINIEGDMAEDYYEMMSKAWDKALVKFKELAEEKA